MKPHVGYTLFFLLLFLPTQLGKHFWFTQSLVLGRRIDYLSPTFYFSDLVILIALFVLLKQPPRLSKSTVFILLGAVSWLSYGWLHSSYQLGPVLYVFRLIEIGIVFWLVCRVKPTPKQIVVPLSVGVIVEGWLALNQFLAQKSLGGWWYWLGERSFTSGLPGLSYITTATNTLLRPYATFPHPNVLGGYLTLILPLLLFFAPRTKRETWLKNTTLALCGLGIFLSFSRVAWVVTAMVIIAWLVIEKRKQLLLLGTLPLLIIEELIVSRFRALSTVDYISVLERQRLSSIALRLFLDDPFLGVGLGNFIPLIPTLSTPPYLLQPVHSLYLLVLAETGFLGFGGLMLLLLLALQRNFKRQRWDLILALSAALGLGLFDHYLVTAVQTRLLFTLLLALSFV